MSETMETHEQAEEAAHGGRKHTALLIAILAAGLAFVEQGAQHADVKMTENAVAATDAWAEYQAKSIRANQAKDFAALAEAIPSPDADKQQALVKRLESDAAHFETDPKTGKAAVAAKAQALEESRDAAHERLESFDNAAAALQLGIVLVTASVITGSVMLSGAGVVLGLIGAAFAVLGLVAPSMGAV